MSELEDRMVEVTATKQNKEKRKKELTIVSETSGTTFNAPHSNYRGLDVRVIWLRHLSPHWSPGLIRLIWLARRVSPSSLTAPCASLPKLHARSKSTTIPDRGGPVFGQGYMSSCAPLLEPPNKLSNYRGPRRRRERERIWENIWRVYSQKLP